MDRFPSMHDEDIDKLGIRQHQPRGAAGDGGRQGRKRARELEQLKGKLDRAAEKEQRSWDFLKQAVGGSRSGVDDGGGRFQATGTNRAAEEMRDRTIGLVTAEEFRKAREAAESLEAAEENRKRDERAAEEAAQDEVKRKADKKRRKAEMKKKRLEKSKMSFALEDDEEVTGGSGASLQIPGTDEHSSPAKVAEESCAKDVGEGACSKGNDVAIGQGNKPNRDLKGAAADDENSSAAAKLKARLAR